MKNQIGEMTQINGANDGSTYEERIKSSLEVIRETFEKYKPEEVFLSFNGGKDCTVLLHLAVNYLNTLKTPYNLKCIYVQPNNPFDEVEEFVKSCGTYYNMKIDIIQGSIKAALEMACNDNRNLKACLMGSRRTDPYCEHLKTFHETDAGWPKLMRVNPMLDWNCDNIWKYLLEHNVPYCSLYEKGYTSLGDRDNTIPNPYLKRKDVVTGIVSYRPAYELEDADHLERAGRK